MCWWALIVGKLILGPSIFTLRFYHWHLSLSGLGMKNSWSTQSLTISCHVKLYLAGHNFWTILFISCNTMSYAMPQLYSSHIFSTSCHIRVCMFWLYNLFPLTFWTIDCHILRIPHPGMHASPVHIQVVRTNTSGCKINNGTSEQRSYPNNLCMVHLPT